MGSEMLRFYLPHVHYIVDFDREYNAIDDSSFTTGILSADQPLDQMELIFFNIVLKFIFLFGVDKSRSSGIFLQLECFVSNICRK